MWGEAKFLAVFVNNQLKQNKTIFWNFYLTKQLNKFFKNPFSAEMLILSSQFVKYAEKLPERKSNKQLRNCIAIVLIISFPGNVANHKWYSAQFVDFSPSLTPSWIKILMKTPTTEECILRTEVHERRGIKYRCNNTR